MSRPQILLVEDNPAHLVILEEALDGIDADIVKAISGKEALACLQGGNAPALIIADLHMAEMSGFELIECLQQVDVLAHIPVIVVTGVYTTTTHMLRGYHMGAVDYLLKPLQPIVLRHKVKHFLRLHLERGEIRAECGRLASALQELGIERNLLAAALQKKDAEKKAVFGQQHNLATISHEIRTPLNAILNFCNLLDDEEDQLSPGERHDYMERIKNNGKHLSRIVDDIINLARAEARKLEISKSDFMLLAEIDSVIESFMIAASRKGIKIVKKIASEAPPTIYSDPTRFKQVLINLLDNAIKFTDSGYIVIELRRPALSVLGSGAARQRQLAGLELRVIDTGCGVASDELESIFEPFRQGGKGTFTAHPGSGLGLTLSHHIAKLLGGDLILEESAVGKGSTFCFSLQVERPHDQPERELECEPERGPSCSEQAASRPPDASLLARGGMQTSDLKLWGNLEPLRKSLMEFVSYIQTFFSLK